MKPNPEPFTEADRRRFPRALHRLMQFGWVPRPASLQHRLRCQMSAGIRRRAWAHLQHLRLEGSVLRAHLALAKLALRSRACLGLVGLLLLAGPLGAATTSLSWSPPASTSAAADLKPLCYVLYAHTNSIVPALPGAGLETMLRVVVGTNLTATLEITNTGRYYFVVTCFAGTAAQPEGPETPASNEVIWEVVAPPTNLRTVILQYSGTLTNFYDVGFFRLRLP